MYNYNMTVTVSIQMTIRQWQKKQTPASLSTSRYFTVFLTQFAQHAHSTIDFNSLQPLELACPLRVKTALPLFPTAW